MRRDEQEATVVELACLTADRTRSEQKALVDVATRVQKRMARQTVEPAAPLRRGPVAGRPRRAGRVDLGAVVNAIGLDLSLTATGYAAADGRLTTIRPQAKATEPERRLSQIVATIQSLTDLTVTVAVLEGVGGQFHGQIGQKLAGLHWAVRLWLFEQRISVAVVEQTRLKKYATGHGKAEKGEVLEAAAVRAYDQGLPIPLDFDQADAFWLRQIALDNQPELRRAWADGDDLDRYRATVLDDLWGKL